MVQKSTSKPKQKSTVKKTQKKTVTPLQKSKTSKSATTRQSSPVQETTQTNWAVPSMVMGIIGLTLVFLPGLGILFSILAIVFYGFHKKQNRADSKVKNSYATAGLVMGIIGTVIQGLILMIALVSILFISNFVQEYATDEGFTIDSRDTRVQEEWNEAVHVVQDETSSEVRQIIVEG